MVAAVTATGLGKRYSLGPRREPYGSFREAASRAVRSSLGRLLLRPGHSPGAGRGPKDFWALSDVSFEVQPGERVGVIGRNGAGKTTLLKILSRITEPTTGRATIRGRVASLLEVGTGFHPELTGRENVFLSGSILGMGRGEIRRKLDEIVAFAQVEQFLDTPVKRYSSGMHLRLAFSVAAHLEPEILVIDEVLAVGDAAFQAKCLGTMESVGRSGRTVLFVSHNLAAVETLCTSAIILERGRLDFRGGTPEAIARYLASVAEREDADLRERADRRGEGNLRITALSVGSGGGAPGEVVSLGADASIIVRYEGDRPLAGPRVILGVYDHLGVGVARLDTDVCPGLPGELPANGSIECSVPALPLSPGRYAVNVALFRGGTLEDYLPAAAHFEVVDTGFFGTGRTFGEADARLTKVFLKHEWKTPA